MRKAKAVFEVLLGDGETALDPFGGSGIFTYAATDGDYLIRSNEWDPYTWRMSSAPWRTPKKSKITDTLAELERTTGARIQSLYASVCKCGSPITVDSIFFDRVPLEYVHVTQHERLGKNGETVTYRQKKRCAKCGATEKFFTKADQDTLDAVSRIKLSSFGERVFSSELIENSRININKHFLVYGNFFPYRSKVALDILWAGIEALDADVNIKSFFQEAFLSIIPQAKYKDYRSKSQDLHAPERQLREVNLWSRFLEAVNKRFKRLEEFNFHRNDKCPIECMDFRDFLSAQPNESAGLVFTDPPWNDGNAYFEKSQIYHPWLNYSLINDSDRLAKEVVVTDAPSRSAHDEARWWKDMAEFFSLCAKKTKPLGYLAVYFRPIPASRWLQNLNRLKFEARKAGYEPLLTIDANSKDPSMRIQQSASFVFSKDLVFVFLRLPEEMRRIVHGEHDLDYISFRLGSQLQEEMRGPFLRQEWDNAFYKFCRAEGLNELILPEKSDMRTAVFERYMREVSPGKYLVKPDTPFNGQYFDIPGQERLFSYVPAIVEELTQDDATFTYEAFLLKLAAFVENGTRMLIREIERVDVTRMLRPYAEPDKGGKIFRRKSIPDLAVSVRKLHDLDPYEFESFTASLLEAQGYTQVALMGGSGDRGVDVVARDSSGVRTVVQCKRYLNNVSADPIQRLHSFAITRNAGRKIVITTAGFTKDAIDEAMRTGTELIDGQELQELVGKFLPDFLSSSA